MSLYLEVPVFELSSIKGISWDWEDDWRSKKCGGDILDVALVWEWVHTIFMVFKADMPR